jgi:hypothetical protein
LLWYAASYTNYQEGVTIWWYFVCVEQVALGR